MNDRSYRNHVFDMFIHAPTNSFVCNERLRKKQREGRNRENMVIEFGRVESKL